MEKENSILDQIIMNNKAQEVASLDAVEIINKLFNELTDREQDVLMRRFGLHGKGKETLENIGNIHSLTRERIRQIETTSVKKLRKLQKLDEYISNLKEVIVQLLEEHGGLMERDYLLHTLVNFSVGELKASDEDILIHKHYLDFMINKLLDKDFELVIGSRHFKHSYKLKYKELEHLEEIVNELHLKIKEEKMVFKTEELIEKIYDLETYLGHKEKLQAENNIDISSVLGSDLYEEKTGFINENKVLFTLLKAAKKIEQNKFGHWGVHNWREIKPKTINDKIYLVLKNNAEPLHFVEIAEKINNIAFDQKKANPATVHNELILDNKYVLVGRGLYGLKEWGFKKGTVADVIVDILNASEASLSRDEIIEKVLDMRMVKKATVILALMNKERFDKIDGKYKLKQA